MATPYYSMDLNGKELLGMIGALFSPYALEGPSIKEYEKLVCAKLKVKYTVPFPSGRTGFYYILKALFQKGDEVIVSSYTFPFYIRLMHEMGIKPVFVDIESEYALINKDLIEEKVTEKTKGILVTHLFGNACDMDEIVSLSCKYEIHLLEDCAHSFGVTYKGAPVGGYGVAGLFSTSPMKVPTTLGGGFIVTNDDDLYQKVSKDLFSSEEYVHRLSRLWKLFTFTMVYYLNSFPWIFSILSSRIFKHLKLKNPGKLRKLFYSELISTKKYDPFERVRFSNMQAKVGISQINRYDEMTAKRRKYAEIYHSYFKDSPHISMMQEKEKGSNIYLYDIAVVSKPMDQFIDDAMDSGLFLMTEDCWYCNDYDFAKDYAANCPEGKKLQPSLARLPNSSMLSEIQIHKIARTILEVLEK